MYDLSAVGLPLRGIGRAGAWEVGFEQFDEEALGGDDPGDPAPIESDRRLRALGDSRATGAQSGKFRFEVSYLIAEVVQATAVLLKEAADGGVLPIGRDEFDERVARAGGEERDPDFLDWIVKNAAIPGAPEATQEAGHGRIDISHDVTDVMQRQSRRRHRFTPSSVCKVSSTRSNEFNCASFSRSISI